ncbi:xanthine dehydrogenase-like [Anthonomus grandis grandis]|uniref:xanthine dehydrogenase-like n=1 Tax=Anthonomus grandis grandis TaxID=2921223 RepID=UPI0021655CDE|nr:xanthine dehydrogenase-like [Anthonomus grandis grandis]
MNIFRMQHESEIRLHVSGKEQIIKASDVTPDTTLNEYLRDHLHLTATKKMCLEGGCGVCIVAIEETDSDGNKKIFAVNSCLVSIYSCHGWKILTNEGIGNPIIGYHKIQTLLAANNGTQCGFCSSGMVMNMYALNQISNLTDIQIENSFGGNLCRCTGYRPILTGFRQLVPKSDTIEDLEDLKVGCSSAKCHKGCAKVCQRVPLRYNLQKATWTKVYTLKDLLEILTTVGSSYMLVGGNTAKGVYWPTGGYSADNYIDITGVVELTTYTSTSSSLVLGGNVTITDTISIFRKTAKLYSSFVYLDKMADHLDLVAHVPVRNIGTLAGNLIMKFNDNGFASDIFLIFETVQARLVIVDTSENETRVTPKDFLQLDMNKKVIKQIILPPYGTDYYYTSYKIMPRAQNAHAMMHAGFLFQLDTSGIVKSARIVYGAVNPKFTHASATETLLTGKQLFDNATLQSAFASLDQEIVPDWIKPDPSPAFRKQLAINLFYKFVLSIAPSSLVSSVNKSGGTLLTRPVSTASQQIYSDSTLYPLTEPVIKLEALAQTSGQAQYIIDKPDLPGQLYGVLVPAQLTPGSTITQIDSTDALKVDGVIAFYSAKDIPGTNSIALPSIAQTLVEELFCAGTVRYFSQPIGVLVATSHDIALNARDSIKVTSNAPTADPVFSVKDVVAQNLTKRITHLTSVVPKTKGSDIKKVIAGEVYVPTQYHFHMENQNCLVLPAEDGLTVYPATQWMDHIQGVISQVLLMPSQKINVVVRRLGGAFGAKITRNAFVTTAAALAAYKLNKPVKMWMNLSDNMEIIGKRYPMYTKYEVGVNSAGAIQYLEASLYTDAGVGTNEPIDSLVVDQFKNCYITDTWSYDTYLVNTDNPSNCYTRAPGNFEAMACIENIMDHIAYSLSLDPLDVRKANLSEKDNPIVANFIKDIEKSDSVITKKAAIEEFNKANRWKKRGISVIPMKWILEVAGTFTTVVSIYHIDGGVAVSHAGIEMGQGINTKVAQVCAYKFGIKLEKVSVKPSYNVASPNAMTTGGSLTSEAVVYSLIKACDVLIARMKPMKDKNPKATWEELVTLCFNGNINLSSNGFFSPDEPGIEEYPIYGCGVLDLEVDILTGKHEILSVDILEDVGRSMSPLIDIGQVEGAFIMGLGCHSTEEIVQDSTTGKILTSRTWNYKPYGFKDIPQDFKVRFSNNTPNPVGVLKSKAIAEPPMCFSVAFPLALRHALASARGDSSSTASPWYSIDGPSTVQQTLLQALSDYKQFTL